MVTRSLVSSVRTSLARFILLGLFLLVVPQALAINGHVTLSVGTEAQRPTIQAKTVSAEELALGILQDEHTKSIPALKDGVQILNENAYNELQLDRLITMLDHSQTYLGSQALGESLNPINDLAEIERRQGLIKKFMHDMYLFNTVAQALQGIATHEEAMLSCWNPADHVTLQAERLYFNLGPFKSLNNSKIALEGMTLFDAGLTFKSLVGTLFLQGLFNELHRWYVFGSAPQKDKIVAGFAKHISDHNFITTNYMHNDVMQQFDAGTINDNQCENLGRQVYVDGTFLDDVRFSEAVHAKHVEGLQGTAIAGIANAWERNVPYKPQAWMGQILAVGFWDYLIYKSVVASKDSLKDTHRNLEALRARMISVAEFIKGIQKLEGVIAANQDLQNFLPAHVINNIALSKSLSPQMQEFVTLLNTATFKKSKSIFYLRGKVLYANKLFQQIKDELIPAMRAMAEIDVYCSIARLMKESVLNANKFTFVTFINSPNAYLELTNCWIPVLSPNEAVANSMTLGQKNPGKMIITGPNGGGKSTHLKAVGQAVALAQSWGIAPARKAQMSIFDAVRTSMDPREDLAHGLSKFMAQKESMDKIQRFILGDPSKVSLILLDEPYDGTVTDEIARRAGEFCDNVVTSNNCLAIVATHIMPVLSNEKLYAWAHVDIAEPRIGTFRRTFRLRSGVAKRWFEDPKWRSRFIDWLSIEMRTKALNNLVH